MRLRGLAAKHTDLPTWMQMIDVALIPYRDTPLNRSCSPMRGYLINTWRRGGRSYATAACQQDRSGGTSALESAARSGRVVGLSFAKLVEESTPPATRSAGPATVQAEAETWSLRAEMLGEGHQCAG